MGAKSGCLFFCLLWLAWAQAAQAQGLNDRLHIRLSSFANVISAREILEGPAPLDRTASFLGSAALLQYDVLQKGKHELFIGLHYGIMSYHRRHVVEYSSLGAFHDWEWDRLGRLSQLGLLLGYRFWLVEDIEDQLKLAFELSGDFSRYRFEKSKFQSQFSIQTWLPAMNIQFLVQKRKFEFGPFARLLSQYPVERNYSWNVSRNSSYDTSTFGRVKSKHGRVQLGLMIGYRL